MHIAWHGFFRVGDARKADRLAQRMAAGMGRDVAVLRAERYWKDAALSVNAGDRISVPGIELLMCEVRSSADDVALGVTHDERPG